MMWRFRRLFLLAVLVLSLSAPLSLPGPTFADGTVDDADAALIRGVIEKQLDALRRDDWAEAFSYAAPFIQRKFGSPETFQRMIMGGYAIVHGPRVVSFKALEARGGRIAQNVLMVAADGKSAMVVYFMEKLSEGDWRIGGVSVEPLSDLNA